MAPNRKLCDEDTESELICNTDSDEYVEDSESDETEDDDDELPSSVMQRQQVMKWGLRSQVNQTHVHRCTGSDREKQNDMTAGVWKDKRNVHMLTNMYDPPAEANFCDQSGSAPKPEIVNIKTNTWGTPIKVTEWRTATLSVIIHINGLRNCSFTSSASQSSTARLCLCPVLLNYHTETSG
jgi:hypothetical protein